MTQNFYINSNNQYGGITAGVVNIAQQKRTLNEQLKKETLKLMEGKDSVQITSVMGDSESHELAYQIEQFLKQSGFSKIGMSQAVFTTPVKGLSYENVGNEVKLIIGSL